MKGSESSAIDIKKAVQRHDYWWKKPQEKKMYLFLYSAVRHRGHIPLNHLLHSIIEFYSYIDSPHKVPLCQFLRVPKMSGLHALYCDLESQVWVFNNGK